MCHVNDRFVTPTYVKVFGILPDRTTLHIVLLRVLEAEFEVPPDCLQVDMLFGFRPRFDLAKGD